MHHVLSAGLAREDWYDSVSWRVAQQEQVANAKDSLQKKAKPITPGRMVAELTFGFWVGLTGPKYSVDLWERHLYKAFPNAKLGRKQLNKRLESIRLLRNRVAHHEPILCTGIAVTFFQAASSITKAFTGVAVMQLAEAGKLDLTAPFRVPSARLFT
jgi:hypothetical protein